jgi:CheY-like chemotaxis protein
MRHILLVTPRPRELEAFTRGLLAGGGTTLSQVADGASALAVIKAAPPALVVVDEVLPDMPGLELVRRIVTVNAFVATALVSALPSGEFHEVSEGLGILMPIPPAPRMPDAQRLLELLRQVAPSPA